MSNDQKEEEKIAYLDTITKRVMQQGTSLKLSFVIPKEWIDLYGIKKGTHVKIALIKVID